MICAEIAWANSAGFTKKTWCGVPAAAQTMSYDRSAGSKNARGVVTCPRGATPPMAKPVMRRVGARQRDTGKAIGAGGVHLAAARCHEERDAVVLRIVEDDRLGDLILGAPERSRSRGRGARAVIELPDL